MSSLHFSPLISVSLPQLRHGPAVGAQPVCDRKERGCFHRKKEALEEKAFD